VAALHCRTHAIGEPVTTTTTTTAGIIQRREILFVAAAMAFILALGILATPLYNLDEIWVYQFSRRIARGFTPYRDFYLLVFPLGLQINAAFLALVTDQLLVLRALAVAVSTGTAVVLYAACRMTGVSRVLCLLPLAALLWAEFMSPANSYTWYAFGFLAAALLPDLGLRRAALAGERGEAMRLAVLTGCLLGLATLSKQHVGVAGMVASLGFTLVAGPRDYRARPNMAHIGLKLAGCFVVVGIELVYLWQADALGAFMRHAVVDVLTFRREAAVRYSTLMQLPGSALLGFLVPASLVFTLAWAIWRWNREPGHAVPLLLFAYGLASLSIAYPRPDLPHMLVAAPLAVAGPSLWVSDRLKALRLRWVEIVVAFPLLLLFFAPLARAQQHLAALRRGDVRLTALHHYAGVPIAPGLDGMISQVTDAIRKLEAEGRRIYFLEHSAALFLIPLDRFADRFDVPMLGNFGPHGVEDVMASVAADPRAAVLIWPGSHALEPKRIIEFVESSMTRAGEVAGYGIYVQEGGGSRE